MEINKKVVWGIIGAVVIVGGLWYGYSRGVFSRYTIVPNLPAGYATKPVVAGQYPQELPKDLILYPQAEPLRGEITTPPGGNTQVITAFVVGDAPLLALNTYVSYLERTFWTKDAQNIDGDVWFARYVKGDESLEVTVTEVDEGSQVQLNYSPGKVLSFVSASTTSATDQTPSPYDFAEDPYAGFSKDLVPANPVSSQYWQSSTQVGALFSVSQNVSTTGKNYQTKVKAAGWTVSFLDIGAERITFVLLNPKTKQTAQVDITASSANTSTNINVRVQK